MAKIVQLSDDAGATYHTLPGKSGTLNLEAGAVDDTIFGADFSSEEIGLINWSVDAQAFYKGFAGFVAKIKQQGTTTAMTGETMSLVSGKTYKIDAVAKEIFDRSATFTVFDGVTDVTAQVKSFNYLFGTITFLASYTVLGAVTIDGSFFPTVTLGKANSFSMTQTADTIETSDFATVQANGGHRTFIQGLKSVSMDLTSFYDVTAGFRAALVARNELLIEIDPAGTGASVARGFFKTSGESQAGDVGALEEETTNFTLNVPEGAEIPFGWEHTGTTTLSQAVVIALTAWLSGGIIDINYLHDGTKWCYRAGNYNRYDFVWWY